MPGPGDPDSGVPDELSWPTEDDDSGVFEVAPQAPADPPKPPSDPPTVISKVPPKPQADPPTVQVQRPKPVKPAPPARPADPPTMRIQVPRPQPKLPRLSPPLRPVVQPGPAEPRALPERIPAQFEQVPAAEPAQETAELSKPAPPATADTPGDAPKRRKPLLLAGALVLVVALVGGVVFAANQLDWFGGTVASTTQPPAPPAAVSLSVKGVAKDAPTPSASGISAALAGPAAAGVLSPLTGVVIDPATGTTLWQQGDTTPLVPASTIKILAAAAALLSVDHTAQLSTKVVQGDLPGTVVVVGGGDPTLSSQPDDVTTVYPGAATLDDLATQVKANTTGPVTAVQFDLGRYAGEGLAPGWDPADIPGGSITPMVPFMVDGGRQDPMNPNSPRTSTPAVDAATGLAQRLGVATATPGTAPSGTGAKVLGEVKSAPIDRLVENAMQISDNILAEALAREVAAVNGQPASFEGAAKAVKDVLTKNQFDVGGTTVVDASGMSPQNKIPAKLLGQIIEVAAKPDASDPRTAKLRPLLTALPVAGGSGTLASRYQTVASSGKGWVRAKTGTLTGVNSLAGAVVDTDGRLLVFAFMSNSPGSADEVRQALDVLAATLRGCGCP
ncbi:D-alanyl-D-alanine carboxypeptidase/D-alanyl-D-alanine-endopeptidase [Umezawaea sp. Da 62-37]|uniref:D-alanyl-D-alanine carboxypeptidase/D-alanyl-D-alanine endopeptidase n=1 Tax=Umezawaea sp. Da 62-37 TaxID=3075927 RepID=UPI0028F71F34|nr:D-alanyl-D-alanine carboxypeptidase/D-alanyl-D-alanine-endopeptidase [Umezawaea sp. Da 62-37]WNV91753.1 D-alanyl-D-alanine carboxypeptidase/D-alanyl-D-alanine-endopeptidase [Umezawaea sp. Da 62-37]